MTHPPSAAGRRFAASGLALAALLSALLCAGAGCTGAGTTSGTGGEAGPVAVSGLVLAPAAGGPSPVAGAAVALGALAGVTDAGGMFHLSSDSLAPGLRDLAVRDGGRLELHYALVVRPREQLLVKLQYDAGTQRLYATECRVDCPEGGATTVRAAVRRALATAAGAAAEEVASLPAKELPAGLTEPQARDEIISRMLAAEADAERAEPIDLADDPSALVASTALRFRPFPSAITLSPALLTLAPGAAAPLEARLVRSDGTTAAAPGGVAASDAPAVAGFDGATVVALSPGTAAVRLSWNGLVSNAVAVEVRAAAPAPEAAR